MSKKVLIIEDSELAQKVYKLLFVNMKECEVLAAMNGFQALEILSRETDIKLIILDINMPTINGLELLKILKTEHKHHDIPVIVVSAEKNEQEKQRAFDLGAVKYFVKPDIEPLKDELISFLQCK